MENSKGWSVKSSNQISMISTQRENKGCLR